MDKMEALLSTAQLAVGVYGNPQTPEFLFLDFPLPDTLADSIARRGVTFLGIIGLVDGQIRAAFDVPLEPPVVSALARDFLGRLEVELTAALDPTGGVAWLNALHSLPDPR